MKIWDSIGEGVKKEGYLTHGVDALTEASDEGRRRLRKASGSCQPSFDPGMSEWGNPRALNLHMYWKHKNNSNQGKGFCFFRII